MSSKKSEIPDIRFVENIKRQWLATIDAMVDPMIYIRNDYIVNKCNKATSRFANLGIKEIIGKKCHKIFAHSDIPCNGCKLEHTKKNQKACTFQLDNIKNSYFFEVSSQPFYDPEGNLDGVIHVYRDRTAAKRLEQQLLQKEKLASIGLLAGGVAHEINNPLGGILIFSQMLLKEMDKNSPHYEDVIEIEAATQRCKVIVDRLLDFARLSPTSDAKKHFVHFKVKDAMLEALKFAKVSSQSRNVEVKEKWTKEEYECFGDKNKAIQLFLNLIQNAFQAMPNGGTLLLKEKNSKTSALFSITDTGVGIPESEKNKIFDPFFTTKDPGEGTGLGLSICHTIAKEFQGELSLTTKKNHGTTFTFSIPKNNTQDSRDE